MKQRKKCSMIQNKKENYFFSQEIFDKNPNVKIKLRKTQMKKNILKSRRNVNLTFFSFYNGGKERKKFYTYIIYFECKREDCVEYCAVARRVS